MKSRNKTKLESSIEIMKVSAALVCWGRGEGSSRLGCRYFLLLVVTGARALVRRVRLDDELLGRQVLVQDRGRRQLGEHLPALHLHREVRQREAGVVQAGARAQVEGLLVQRAGHLGGLARRADDALREDGRAHVRADVLCAVPLPAAGEVEDGQLCLPPEHGGAALLREVVHSAHPLPLGLGVDDLGLHGHPLDGLGPVRRPLLPPLGDVLDELLVAVRVDELPEALAHGRVGRGRGPLVLVRVHHVLHLRLQVRVDLQVVVDDDLFQVVNAARQPLQPGRGPLELVGRLGVVHEEAVQVLDGRVLVDGGGEQVPVAGLDAAVAAHVQVVARLGGNEPKVLALRLRALARAAGDRALQLVRRAEALVPVLHADGKAHGVLLPVAAPGAAHAALHRAQALGVGVPRLQAHRRQPVPDLGQLVLVRAEEVHTLAARDLRVQAVLLGHLTHGDELLGHDLPAGHAGHHRVGAPALHVAQAAVVRVQQRQVLGQRHHLVPGGGQDGGHGRLARLAAVAAAPVRGQQVLEGPRARGAHNVVQLLPRVGEVLAQRGVQLHAGLLHGRLEQLLHVGHAPATARARLGAGLGLGHRGQPLLRDGRHDLTLVHVVAGAHLEAVVHVLHAAGRAAPVGRAEHQLGGRHRQGLVRRHQVQQLVEV
mmetsp:Transcript_3581/g.6125  ORF Transcript_3581/g.6125 Transcript_3581/m.6125 type:complete len:655 (+) Transcript_3581:123-2087(+)